MRSCCAMGCVGLLLGLLGCNPLPRQTGLRLGDQPPFIIAVVGDGVRSEAPATRDHPLNNAQGLAMGEGAFAAAEKSPSLGVARKYVRPVGYDDGGSVSEAARIARQLQADPRVLAVIGHATSGTTRAAASLYAEAGIPLLMPIATSPYAVYRLGAKIAPIHRLRNCFRLPPVDDPIQSRAVAYVAREVAHSSRCYLFRDISEDAAEYSEPLFKRLEMLLADAIVRKRAINRDDPNILSVAQSVQASKADLVVFCGYGTTAQELLHALRLTYERVAVRERPKVLLTDGCKTRDVDPSGFDVYVTFPLPDLNSADLPIPRDLRILRGAVRRSSEESYQSLGYDAMLMIGHALEDCVHQEVSRRCLLTALSNAYDFRGAFSEYDFKDGENVRSHYYVYASRHGSATTFGRFAFEWRYRTPRSRRSRRRRRRGESCTVCYLTCGGSSGSATSRAYSFSISLRLASWR